MSIRLTTSDIVKATGGRLVTGYALAMMELVCLDSRKATPGSIFVPLKGKRRDGHSFIGDAFKRGASAAFVKRGSSVLSTVKKKHTGKNLIEVDDPLAAMGEIARYWRQKLRLPVVAIAGSQTALTRDLAWHIAREPLVAYKSRDDWNDLVGLPRCLCELEGGHKAAILEMGMNGPEGIRRLAEICDPTIGIITDGGSSGQGGVELVRHLGAGHTVLLNSDNPSYAALAKETSAMVVTFGTKKADIHTRSIRPAKGGRTAFDLHVRDEKAHVTMKTDDPSVLDSVPGAAAVAHVLGVGTELIKAGLEQYPRQE